MDYKKVENQISEFIKRMISEAGMKKAVIGLSGGIDSTVVAYLTVKAIGKENIYGMILPSIINSKNDILDAKYISDILKINCYLISIQNIVNDYFKECCVDKIRIGNFMARIRMSILYDKAKENNALVVGTTNKTEMYLGYFTKYGDGGVDIEPIADLFKTEIFELAKHLGVPENIINKPPSADLWEGQTDEDELGMSYEKIDEILKHISYGDCIRNQIKDPKYRTKDGKKVLKLLIKNNHKRIHSSKCIISMMN